MHEHHTAHRCVKILLFPGIYVLHWPNDTIIQALERKQLHGGLLDVFPRISSNSGSDETQFEWSSKVFHKDLVPLKYCINDFGLLRLYDANEKAPLEDVIIGEDRTVPDFRAPNNPQNTFRTDLCIFTLKILSERDSLTWVEVHRPV